MKKIFNKNNWFTVQYNNSTTLFEVLVNFPKCLFCLQSHWDTKEVAN